MIPFAIVMLPVSMSESSLLTEKYCFPFTVQNKIAFYTWGDWTADQTRIAARREFALNTSLPLTTFVG
ncbi:MAG: hypothetical protein CL946_08050 [Ectothiorhodospiraceae bacterium]|nr:hypothetical protein [Ectothiorhodospiraceae bacterium]